MRTNIEIDDELMAQAMEAAGTQSKRATVDLALRTLVRTSAYETLASLRGKVAWEGDLDAMRTGEPVIP